MAHTAAELPKGTGPGPGGGGSQAMAAPAVAQAARGTGGKVTAKRLVGAQHVPAEGATEPRAPCYS